MDECLKWDYKFKFGHEYSGLSSNIHAGNIIGDKS